MPTPTPPEDDGYLFSRSVDNGASFSSPLDLMKSPGVSEFFSQAMLDHAGNINLVWGNGLIRFSRSTDGSTFSKPVVVADTTKLNPPPDYSGLTDQAQMAFDSKNDIYILWGEGKRASDGGCISQITSSRDGGATFSTPVNLEPDICSEGSSNGSAGTDTSPELFIDSTDAIDIVRGANSYRSVDGAHTFSRTSNGSQNLVAAGWVQAVPSPNIDILWYGYLPPTVGPEIFFM